MAFYLARIARGKEVVEKKLQIESSHNNSFAYEVLRLIDPSYILIDSRIADKGLVLEAMNEFKEEIQITITKSLEIDRLKAPINLT